MQADIPAAPALTTRQRWISLAEIALGTFIVIGHNIFHIIPNEVPILFVLFWVSFRIRDGGYKLPGLTRPKSWPKTVLLAVAAVILLQGGGQLLIEPLAHHIWPQPEHVSSVIHIAPFDWKLALRNLAIVWVFAGFGEELGYRGYLLNRAADVGNRTRAAYILAALFVAVIFGFGHYYKGPAGVMDSTWSGLVLGAVYLISGRNLWAAVLAHGLSDTVAVAAYFMGWAN